MQPSKQTVMQAAWSLARQGVVQFGGSVRDYLSQALRDAWRVNKAFAAAMADPVMQRIIAKQKAADALRATVPHVVSAIRHTATRNNGCAVNCVW